MIRTAKSIYKSLTMGKRNHPKSCPYTVILRCDPEQIILVEVLQRAGYDIERNAFRIKDREASVTLVDRAHAKPLLMAFDGSQNGP